MLSLRILSLYYILDGSCLSSLSRMAIYIYIYCYMPVSYDFIYLTCLYYRVTGPSLFLTMVPEPNLSHHTYCLILAIAGHYHYWYSSVELIESCYSFTYWNFGILVATLYGGTQFSLLVYVYIAFSEEEPSDLLRTLSLSPYLLMHPWYCSLFFEPSLLISPTFYWFMYETDYSLGHIISRIGGLICRGENW